MSMNLIDAAGVLADSVEVPYHDLLAREAKEIVQATVNAYDALAPDWSQAPDWAKWYTMFDNGEVIFWELEPKCIFLSYEWVWKEKDEKIGLTISRMSSKVPIAIDWRLCKWQRPEVAP